MIMITSILSGISKYSNISQLSEYRARHSLTVFITQRLRFDNTLYFYITLTANGVIVLWSAFI